MSRYIATFHSHFGALSYYNSLKKQNIPAKLMPVPRQASSSCGTCVYYEHIAAVDLDDCELDCVYCEVDNQLKRVLTHKQALY
ncbi:MAG: DUF3343 domain-containing protein [Deltaproteobacteria bacterium]|nr:DUF3343 domain-containing protein [Deltaproteobacteria bacterium]